MIMKISTKKIAYFAMGIALYVVLGLAVKIPLISHISTDLGYIAYGCFLYLFGAPAFLVGSIGCVIESLLVSGWFPYGWLPGQILIGLICGTVYIHSKNKYTKIFITIIAVFIGIAIVKTAIECTMFEIPLAVKFPKNFIAFIADTIPMLIGLYLGKILKGRIDV